MACTSSQQGESVSIAKSNSAGFSLIEVIVAAAILLIISIGMGNMIANQAQQIENLRTAVTKNSLVSSIRALVGSPSIITQTALYTNVAQFQICTAQVAGVCIQGAAPLDVGLWQSAATQITGTSAAPYYYARDGTLCTANCGGNAQYPIMVYTQFIASCGIMSGGSIWGAGQTCTTTAGASAQPAYELEMIYYIKQDPAVPAAQLVGQTPISTICNDPTNAAVCKDSAVIIQLPVMGSTAPVAGKLGYWSTSMLMGASSVVASDAANQANCNANNMGMIRAAPITVGVSSTTMFQVCVNRAGSGYGWSWLSGAADSPLGAFSAATTLPYMPGMYNCPVDMPTAWSCPGNPNPPCAGQIQMLNICHNAGCSDRTCTPLF